LTSAVTAASRLLLVGPPRLRFATAGVPATWFAAAQSNPAMTPDMLPDPLQSRTRTATGVAPFATPWVLPARVPATWVPWPLQSPVPRPSLIAV
jgi:hypothetical protein